nr:FGGY-family carbohydrate kinase [Cohaesibacter sp. ES.047]
MAELARTNKDALSKNYVRLWLTGEHVAEMSDAAGTLWLDVAERRWSPELLEATGLNSSHMPGLVEGSEGSGMLRAELGEARGGDNAATACGMGVITPGTGFLSLGPSGLLFAAADRFAPNTEDAVHAFCHAVPETGHQMGVILSATDSFTWLSEITGQEPAKLAGLLPEKIIDPTNLSFLPYLSGERTPHNKPNATGAFVGLQRVTRVPDFVQATMEGVAMAFADCVRVLKAAGTEIEAAYAVGGGSRSDLWQQIMAAVTSLTLLKPEGGDCGAAFGAARLGTACATGDTSAAIFASPKVDLEFKPDADLAEKYMPKYQAYRDSYLNLQKER